MDGWGLGRYCRLTVVLCELTAALLPMSSLRARKDVPLELCALSALDDIILVDMETSILGEPQSQSFDEVQDSESKASGDNSGLTFCGPRIYSIIDLPPYI